MYPEAMKNLNNGNQKPLGKGLDFTEELLKESLFVGNGSEGERSDHWGNSMNGE